MIFSKMNEKKKYYLKKSNNEIILSTQSTGLIFKATSTNGVDINLHENLINAIVRKQYNLSVFVWTRSDVDINLIK